MTSPEQVSFDTYLDAVFAGPDWLDACVGMLAVFLEDIDSCREDIARCLPERAPSIVDQVIALNARAERLHHQTRSTAEQRGPVFQTPDLGAVLWRAGMASHKAGAAGDHAPADDTESLGRRILRGSYPDVRDDVRALIALGGRGHDAAHAGRARGWGAPELVGRPDGR